MYWNMQFTLATGIAAAETSIMIYWDVLLVINRTIMSYLPGLLTYRKQLITLSY
jgi:hypothetical protein